MEAEIKYPRYSIPIKYSIKFAALQDWLHTIFAAAEIT